ncbi:MAG: hypothetical protein V1651_03865, partial [Patescibacteria group bacterium]
KINHIFFVIPVAPILLSFPRNLRGESISLLNFFSFVIPAEPKKRESIFFFHSRSAKKAGIHFLLSFQQRQKSGNQFSFVIPAEPK